MYLICQGAGTAAVSYKFASQREHPLYRQAGGCSGMSAWGRSWCKPTPPACRVGKFPQRSPLELMPLSVTVTLQQLQLPPGCSSVYESLGWFSKGVYVPGTEIISLLDLWAKPTHHAPLLQLLIWHFEPFWQKNINLNSSFMFTSEQWLCVGVTAGRSFARVRPSKVTSDSLFSFSRTGILP